MSSPLARPRGPLPPRVYWVRRLALLTLLAVLGTGMVAGFAALLGTGEQAPRDTAGPVAESSALPGAGSAEGTAGSAPGATGRAPTPAATPAATVTGPRGKVREVKVPLVAPQGECDPADLEVEPVVLDDEAGRDVAMKFRVRSITSPACTFQASGHSLVVRITSGSDRIWTSQDCPRTIDAREAVARTDRPAVVTMTWRARRSVAGCEEPGDWALPGWYHVTAAALGGEPTDRQFRLVLPAQTTRTETVTPSPTDQAHPRDDATRAPHGREHRHRRHRDAQAPAGVD